MDPTACRNHSHHLPDCPYCVVASVDTEVITRLRQELAAKATEIAALKAELALHEAAAPATNDLAKRQRERAERAEAANERVKALHARVNTEYGKACDHCRGSDEEPMAWPCPTIAALDQPDDQPKEP